MRTALAAFFGLAAIAGLVFLLVRETNADRTTTRASIASTYPAFFLRQEFKDWLGVWKVRDPYLAPEEFRLVRVAPLTLAPSETASAVPPRAIRSQDGTHAVDILASYGEPDSRVDLDGSMLAFCGTACRFDRAFWVDDDTLVVLGAAESYKHDGTQLCTGEGDGRTCYERLTAVEYDLASGEERAYESADRIATGDPFDAEKARAWFADRPAEERAIAGVYNTAELLPFSGDIVSSTHRQLTVRQDDGTLLDVIRVYGRVGTRIALVDVPKLGPGARVEGAGLRSDTDALVATEIAIKRQGDVYIHAPTLGEVVDRTLVVDISVAPNVNQVVLRVSDEDGASLAGKIVPVDSDRIEKGRVALHIPITLPRITKEGATCTISVSSRATTAAMSVPVACGPLPTPVDN